MQSILKESGCAVDSEDGLRLKEPLHQIVSKLILSNLSWESVMRTHALSKKVMKRLFDVQENILQFLIQIESRKSVAIQAHALLTSPFDECIIFSRTPPEFNPFEMEEGAVPQTMSYMESTDFFEQCQRNLKTSNNPFQQEKDQLKSEKGADIDGYAKRWKVLSNDLKKGYSKRDLDLEFFGQQLNESLTSGGRKKTITPEGVRRRFLKRWEGQLKEREFSWKIAQISTWRDAFLKDLKERLKQLLEIKKVVGELSSQLGRLWDLSKGNWSIAGLADLKRYAEILESKKVLIELAEMLGRLAVAEKEFEERS